VSKVGKRSKGLALKGRKTSQKTGLGDKFGDK